MKPQGGANYFAIEDGTANVIPFKVMAGAPADALNIASNGNIGFSTSNPVIALHANNSNTPGLRLEQNSSAGWTPYTWDVSGNEANFFIRDITGGSTLPFRIRAGAPTSSVDISSAGNVGIGTTSPTQKLDVNGCIKLSAILTTPTSPTEGVVYMDGTDHSLKFFNGTSWQSASDKQNLVDATLTGTILQIDIENGTSVSVDLNPLLSDLDARLSSIETSLGIKKMETPRISISQNSPNPFNSETSIPFYIPNEVQNASLVIYNVKGAEIKKIEINERESGNLKITGKDVETGSYFYTVVLDGKKLESKIMIRVD